MTGHATFPKFPANQPKVKSLIPVAIEYLRQIFSKWRTVSQQLKLTCKPMEQEENYETHPSRS
jgi:hypothetical protein